MKKKILLVEDEAIIAMTTAKMIEKHGFEVVTAHKGDKAVEMVDSDSEISLILMDIDLGKGIDGTEAAQKILEKHDIPIVFLSSHTEPEVVEKTEGITSYGYIVKNSGETVTLASIKMAFRLYEAHMELKRQKVNLQTTLTKQEETEEELQLHMQRYQHLFNNINSCVAVYESVDNGEDFLLLDFNKSAEKTEKISKEEVIGKKVTEVFPAVQEFELLEAFKRVAKYGETEHLPVSQYKDERIVGWRDNYVYKLPSGEVVVVYEDLTEQKRLEQTLKENEEDLRITLNSIGDAVLSTDTDGNITRMNPVAEKLTGWEIDSAKGKNLNEVFHIIHADTREVVDNPVEKVLQYGEIVGLSNHTALISKEGNEYQIADSAAPIKDDEGNINGVVLVFRDVTDEYEKDRKITENEKKYRSLFNSIRDAILVADTDRNIIDCNPAFTDLFGYSLEELHGKKTVSVYESEEEYTQMGKAIKEHKGDLKDFLFPVHYRRKDGKSFPGETNVFYLRDDNDDVSGFIGLIRDISDRKKAENDLERSKNRYKRLVNNSPNLIMETDVDTHEIISCNPAMAKNLSTTIQDIIGGKLDDFIPKNILKKRLEVSQKAIETGEPQTLEDERNGNFFHTTYIPIISNDRRSVQTITLDVTEQKKSENLIKEYANRLELTMEAANMAWWEMDIKSGKVGFNRKKTDMLDYSADQFQHYEDFTKLVHPDDYEPMMTSMRALLNGTEKKYDIEYRIKAQSGEYRWFHDIGTITKRSEEGAPVKVAGIVLDITERKLTEVELRRNEKDLRESQRIAHIGSWRLDVAINQVTWTEELYNMYGLDPSNPPPPYTEHMKLFTPESWERLSTALDHTRQTGIPYMLELETVRKDGSNGWMWVQGEAEVDSAGKTTEIWGAAQDITERKRAEMKLAESEALLDATSFMAHVGGWQLDVKTKAITWTKETYRIHEVPLNYKPSLDMAIEFFHPDDHDTLTKAIQRALDKGEPYDMELRFITDKANNRWTRTICQPEVVNGKTAKLRGTFQDITERKKLEIELKSKTEFLSNVTENMFDLVSLTNLDGNFTYVSKSHEILGYNPADMVGSNVMDLVHPEDYPHVEKEFKNFLLSKENKKVEYRYRHADGAYLWFETLGKILTDEVGNPEQILFSTRDITDRKQTEEALFVKTMALESSMNAIAIADMKGALIYVNPSFIKMWGYQEKKEIIGKQSTAFWESKEKAEQVKRAVVENQKWIGELKAKRKDGQLFDTQLSANMILNDSHEPQGMLASFLDITERKQAEQDLRESQERFQILHNASFGGITIHDKGVIIDCNQGLSDITGYSYDELVGMDGLLLIAPVWRDFVMEKISSGYEDPYKAEGIRKDNSIYPVRLHGKQISYKGKQVRVVEFRDITEQKKIEEQQILLNTTSVEMLEIDDRKELYDYIATQLHSIYPEAFVIYLSVNETKSKVRIETIKGLEYGLLSQIAALFGYNLLGKEYEIDEKMIPVFYSGKLTYLKEGLIELSSNVLPNTIARKVQKIAGIKETYAIGVLKDKQLVGAIHIFCRKPSELKYNTAFVESLVNQAGVMLHKNQLENQLRRSLEEKDYLMKELNHRVKNNLAMVSSLIGLKDSETDEDLSNLIHRINVIKLIHEKLYQQNDAEQIEVKEYFQELLESIFSSTYECDVDLVNNIEEVSIPTKTAMTLGLVVNEIATNAIKYGFNDREEAQFTVAIISDPKKRQYILKLSNTGNPFPEEIGLENPKTMGLQLVSILVKQLNGTIELQKKPNPVFTIRFPLREV